MTRSLPAAALAVALAVALSACGEDDDVTTGTPGPPTTSDDLPTSAPPPHGGADITLPTEPDASVAELSIVGLFPVQPPYVDPAPVATVYADGRVIVPGEQTLEYPGPMVGPLFEGRLGEAAVRDLLSNAADAGLLGEPPEYTEPVPPTTDAPITTLTLTTAEGSWTHTAPALSKTDTGPRGVLFAFTTELQALASSPSGAAYTPERLAVQAIPADQAPPVDEGLEPPPAVWPESGPDLATVAECVVVDDPVAVEALLGATSITRFTDGTATWAVAAAPVLPGQPGC